MVKLRRELSFLGLLSTGICSMLGASVYLVPFMIHRNVPGIGPYVLPAFMVAAMPATFAALAYAILAAAMPRAGGAYIYASRGLSPYLGFVASFAQWFGLSIAIGVIGYVIVPFVRDVCAALGWEGWVHRLETGWVRVTMALLLLWSFILVNLKGLTFYERVLIPMMMLMFVLGSTGIVIGFSFDHQDFTLSSDAALPSENDQPFQWGTLLSAAAILMSSFIGFDSIAQAGGEVRNPSKWLPRAILLCIALVGGFYFLFTGAMYHAVPWSHVAAEASVRDITAPGLLAPLIPSYLTVLLLAGAAIALINDLPAMFLSVSRLLYAWAIDGVFPSFFAHVRSSTHVPSYALICSGGMASLGVLGSHFAGDFFLGVDIMVISMLLNFILLCLTILFIPHFNPALAEKMQLFGSARVRQWIATLGLVLLMFFLGMHIYKDLSHTYRAWYFHATPVWLLVMIMGSLVYFASKRKLAERGVDLSTHFKKLPEE